MPLPPKLTPDSRIAVIAPASAPPDPERYNGGLAALREIGLQVEAPDEIRPMGYFAGPDDLRIEQLNDLFRRDDLDAIFCARGGYGTLRLLPHLDYDALREHPKLIVGYSDITALQMAVLAKADVPSLSGAMVAPDWSRMDAYSEDIFWGLAEGEVPFELDNPDEEPLWTLNKGEAEGRLVGGNLTMITSLIGTPYLPDLDGAILFVEDVGEPPYRVDRMFAQLELAGILESLSGMILGAFLDSRPHPNRPSLHLKEVIGHYADKVDGPVAGGLRYGHLRPKATMPIGTQATLEAKSRAAFLTITEPAVE